VYVLLVIMPLRNWLSVIKKTLRNCSAIYLSIMYKIVSVRYFYEYFKHQS